MQLRFSTLISFVFLIILYSYNSVCGKDPIIVFPNGENIEVEQEYLPVIGKNDKKDVKITLNNSAVTTLKLEKGNIFRDKLKLNPGLNEIKVTTGADTQSIKVFFAKDNKNTQPNFKKLSIHPPVLDNECTECHTKEVKEKFPSVDHSKVICSNCHDSYEKDKFLHGPVGTGACSACHDAHGSTENKFLRMDKNKICYMCHEEESVKSEHLANLKAGNKEECVNCHSPHSGKDKFFLKETKK